MEVFTKFAPYYKAVAAFLALLIPLLTALATALTDGTLTGEEFVVILSAVGALIGGTRAVYQVPNLPHANLRHK